MPDPESLKRDAAGSYHTPDRRFTVEKTGTSWYLRDAKQLDELGLPQVAGPFATLDEARAGITAARERKVVSLGKRGESKTAQIDIGSPRARRRQPVAGDGRKRSKS
jgi:hypothetical protein